MLTGDFSHAGAFSGAGDDTGKAIATDSAGNVYSTGYFYGTADFDPGAGTFNLTSAGSYDVFISKLTQEFLFKTTGIGADQIVLRRKGPNLEIFDTLKNQVVAVSKLSFLLGVQITGASNQADRLTIDYPFGGSFSLPQGIRFSGGTGGGDILVIAGRSIDVASYLPSLTGAGASVFEINSDVISMTGVESAILSGVGSLTVETQGSADALVANPATGYNGAIGTRISGTSGGVAIKPLVFDRIPSVTIDLGANDAALASSNDSLTFAANSLEAARLKYLTVSTGKGADVLTVNNADLGLPASGGSFQFLGGTGVDRLVASGNTDLQINDARRISGAGGKIVFDDIERATVLEQDTILYDVSDEISIKALGGDDLIAIDLTFTILGVVDGGDGLDTCTAPAAWTKVSC